MVTHWLRDQKDEGRIPARAVPISLFANYTDVTCNRLLK